MLHERALVVGVEEPRVELQLAGLPLDPAFELRQRERAVENRITAAELVEVDPVHDLHPVALAHHSTSSATAARTSSTGTSQPVRTSPGSLMSTNGVRDPPTRFLS